MRWDKDDYAGLFPFRDKKRKQTTVEETLCSH